LAFGGVSTCIFGGVTTCILAGSIVFLRGLSKISKSSFEAFSGLTKLYLGRDLMISDFLEIGILEILLFHYHHNIREYLTHD